MVSFLRKTLKVVLWMIISLVLLFITLAILIQIPAIQTRIVRFATTYVSNKTHTRVEIGYISIAFPKSVVIEGIFLEDTKKDTLLYAGKIKVNIALFALIHSEIQVRSLALEDVNVNLNRAKTDSLFNFNFLITAFSDTTKKPKPVEPKKESKWTFSVDDVGMKNIRFHFNDDYGGTHVAVKLKEVNLKVDKIDIPHLVFAVDAIKIDGLSGGVSIMRSGVASKDTSSGKLPVITASDLQISNSNFTFTDSVGKLSVLAMVNMLTMKNASVDLPKENISLGKMLLSKSRVMLNRNDQVIPDTSNITEQSGTSQNKWTISAKEIGFEDNYLAYAVVNEPNLKNSFDVNHLRYHNVSLAATDLYYSAALLKAKIKDLKAMDDNNFSIEKFEADFSMDAHSIVAKNLIAVTAHSSMDADLSMQYASLQTLRDSMQNLMVNAGLRNVNVRNSDIIYFAPQLSHQPYFKNAANIAHISGLIHGSLKSLHGENLAINAGIHTYLLTDFFIRGLPDYKTATFDFPNLKITSGRTDILAVTDTLIPKSIELPDNIGLQIVFKGQLNAFASTILMNSSYGDANITASVDKNENFKGNVSLTNFDLGSLLKNKAMFGPVSLTAETNGHGLDKKTLTATIKADVSQLYLNKYEYHKLTVDGNITADEFSGKINLNDENAVFAFDGIVNINPAHEQFDFTLNVLGADLQKLKLTKEDVRIAMTLNAGLKSDSLTPIHGNAGINGVTIVHLGKQFDIDTLLSASINEPAKSKNYSNSALLGLIYNGSMSPFTLPKALMQYINHYFPFSDTIQLEPTEMKDFAFTIQLHNNPVIPEVLLPQLTDFEPGIIQGGFDSRKNELILNASMKRLVYGSTEINDLMMKVNSDATALNYKLSGSSISNSQIKLDNVLVDGKLADNTLFVGLSSLDENLNKKLLLHAQIIKDNSNYKITLSPNDFYLMNKRWDIAADNFLEFGKDGLLIHHLFISKSDSHINIASVHEQFKDDLNIAIKNFNLNDISGIIQKDSSLFGGIVDGNVLFKRVNNAYGIIADAKISDLMVHEVPIGNLTLKAENPISEKFNVDVNLSGAENHLTATGYFIPGSGDNSININSTIQSLSMKTVEAFSLGNISETAGNLTGSFLISGKTSAPDISGEITFNNAFAKTSFLNNRLQLKHETIQVKNDGIYFNSFTVLDANQHTAIINGSVGMSHFSDFVFALNVNTTDFLLLNTTVKDNKEFFGRMVIDSKINIKGPLSLPVVDAKIKMKKGSNFTFAVPEERLSTDKGEDVVEFSDSLPLNPILSKDAKKEKQKYGLTGFDISSIVEVDKEATLRLLLDPTSTDSLVVKGEAALSFTSDRSGKISLTGAYNLNEGSYLVSLESVLKRKFNIEPGGTIIWNGDLLGAEISVNADYTVRASPIDLIADQMSVMSETDRNQYKQRFPFMVILKLRGEMLHPVISFEIQLPPEQKGILGGAVNAKLNMLNEDPSALNKQVFALLVLGRFIQENPLQSETASAMNIARNTVGKYVSTQINQLTSKLITGVEINFDIQSYDDYQSGQAVGRTQVDIGVKKQLFKERVSVQVGGTVDVEGPQAKQNTAADIISDVSIEYKITSDGRYLLKGFRNNQYKGAFEGQVVETGIGLVFVHDFDKWKDFFKSPQKTESIKPK